MARQARSLDVLLAEVNAMAPRRNKASDGGIGDAKHSAAVSDHNPNRAGVWRARDFTHDPAGGLDCNALATALVPLLGRHPALGSGAYLIWRSRIISTDRLSAGWRRYTGSNPHDKHLHVSVATAASGYDSTAPWGIASPRVEAIATPREELDPMLYISGTNNYVVYGHNGGWVSIAYTPNDPKSEYANLVRKCGEPTWVNPSTLANLIADSRDGNSALLAEIGKLAAK